MIRTVGFSLVFERCNGRDDNCVDGVDEGYEVGAECAVGVGACRNASTLRCSADGLGRVCGAVPGLPEAETCDGIDNDCNQAVDDVSLAGTADVDNCGGCNVQCVPEANQVPACEATLMEASVVSLIVRPDSLTSIEKLPMAANTPA